MSLNLRCNLKYLLSLFLLAFFLSALSLSFAKAPIRMANVSGFARSFPLNSAISSAKITILETGKTYQTDVNGSFGPINYPVGKAITLVFEKFGYKTTQSATIIVPPEGLSGPYNNITFQVPQIPIYYLLVAFMGVSLDGDSCHVAATITGYHKTLNDERQGETGAIAMLSPRVDAKPFYFDIFTEGRLKDKTNPFTKGLSQVTADGGIAYFNLPPSNIPYTLSALKQGKVFSDVQFLCRKGAFINISPPLGPSVQEQA